MKTSVPLRPNSTVDECESTNDLCRQLVHDGHPHGTYISATTQTAGRGRSGNIWTASRNNLYISILLRDVPPSFLTWVPLMTAIAVQEALEAIELSHDVSKKIRIKWPNDLYLDDRKLGGILCESLLSPPVVIAGIGLNTGSIPTTLEETAISLFYMHAQRSSALDEQSIVSFLERFRPTLAQTISKNARDLTKNGPDQILKKYEQTAYFQPGDAISWSETEIGTVIGLGSMGELRAKTRSGEKLLFSEVVQKIRKA